jgi:hypothetical protein
VEWREDPLRAWQAFSKVVQQASKLMFTLFAYDREVAEVLGQWRLKRQPCQFDRTAANRKQIYFFVLRERRLAPRRHERLSDFIDRLPQRNEPMLNFRRRCSMALILFYKTERCKRSSLQC